MSVSGILTTVAGNGARGFSGDGGLATSASLSEPSGVAVDGSGNLFIADQYNCRIRKVSAGGVITTVAGNGNGGFSGDGGPATVAMLAAPSSVAVDSSGNLFIGDNANDRVRKVSASGVITTVAGNGTHGFCCDGGAAISAALSEPIGIAVDGSGNLFIADHNNSRIRMVSASGIITTVAGNGNYGFSGDGGPATSASLSYPIGVAVDASGNLFIADDGNNRIREVSAQASSAASLTVSPTGLDFSLMAGGSASRQLSLTTVAGVPWSASASNYWITLAPSSGTAPGTISVSVDTTSLRPGAYTAAITISNRLASPQQETVNVSLTVAPASLAVAPTALSFQLAQGTSTQSQTLQIGGDASNPWHATPATASGGAWLSVSPGAGNVPASLTAMVSSANLTAGIYYGSITVQASGATPPSTSVNVSLAIGKGGVVTTVAGNGTQGFSGDGQPAVSASLSYPGSVAVDAFGNLFIADSGNNRIRKVSASGIITTVAGNGTQGFSGDGGPAVSASLNGPADVKVDASGNLFIADQGNNRIRKVSASGIITTVAGSATAGFELGGFSGDGGPASLAMLDGPGGIAVDASGNLFIADYFNQRIRRVSASGIITTVAGSGALCYISTLCGGFSGDGGPATLALLNYPMGVAVDASGELFIVDHRNDVIREVSALGEITTVAGTGNAGFSGDGGPATVASLNSPMGVGLDASGNLFIADTWNNRIRSSNGIIMTVAGGGSGGDGGPATSASFDEPRGVAVDTSGNLFVADWGNHRIRKVAAPASTTPPAPFISPGGIVPVDSTVGTIQPGEWCSIYGTNLASSTVTWNGNFPQSLGGTSVTIDGKAAYLWYVSPGQINAQAPDDAALGPVQVAVTTPGGTATATVTLAQFAPSFLLFDSKHAAGIILRSNGTGAYGGGTYDILGPTGTSLGYPTVAAKAGDIVELFGTGFGPSNPSVPAGQTFVGAAPTTNGVSLLINNVSVIPAWAGLSGAGLEQINLTIPAGLGAGDVLLVATVGGAQTQAGVAMSLQ